MTYEKICEKKIIFYKIGKIQQDMEDFFDKLDVLGYIEDDANLCRELYNGKAVLYSGNLSEKKEIIEKLDQALIIICSFECDAYRELLLGYGLEYKKNFINATDLIRVLSESETYSISQTAPRRRIIVMGTGAMAKKLMFYNSHLNVEYFIDNDSAVWGSIFFNKDVKPTSAVMKEEKGCFIIIIASCYFSELKTQLSDLGLEFGKDFYFYFLQAFEEYNPADLLEKTIRDEPQYSHECTFKDYDYFFVNHVTYNGLISICCNFTPFPAGSICHDTVYNSMNSTYSRIQRLSVKNKTYSFCSIKCPIMQDKGNRIDKNKKCQRGEIQINYPFNYLWNVLPCYDISCNLSCRSCRKTKMTVYENEVTQIVHEEFCNTLPLVKYLWCATGGEPLHGKYFRDLLFEQYKGDNVVIHSNGLLFNEDCWRKLKGKFRDFRVYLSVDAASTATYKIIRGADFNVLYRNLKMISELRKSRDVCDFRLFFVVQRDNFREMVDFANMGLELFADQVRFFRIYNWGTFEREEFLDMDVYDCNNKYHSEFVAILKAPVFSLPHIVVENKDNFMVK